MSLLATSGTSVFIYFNKPVWLKERKQYNNIDKIENTHSKLDASGRKACHFLETGALAM